MIESLYIFLFISHGAMSIKNNPLPVITESIISNKLSPNILFINIIVPTKPVIGITIANIANDKSVFPYIISALHPLQTVEPYFMSSFPQCGHSNFLFPS